MSTVERTRYWEEQILAWQASGESGQAFCKAQGLVYHRFMYWRRKILSAGRTAVGDRREVASGFARVAPASHWPDPSLASGLTIELPNGVSITGLHAGNVALLGDILRQL